MRKRAILKVLKMMMSMLCAAVLALADHAAGAPSMLAITGEYDGTIRPWQQDWLDAGYQIKAMRYWNLSSQVTWEVLSKFNLVVITLPVYDSTSNAASSKPPWAVSTEEWKTFCALLDRYLNTGGGVLFYGNSMGTLAPAAVEMFLKPYDANVLFEQVTDPQQTFTQTSKARWSYGWTTAISPGPLTQGVKTIFYPATKFMYGPTTSPLKLSREWQVLVAGSPTAHSLAPSYPSVHNPGFSEGNLGDCTASPPLIACRTVGKGRLAVSGISPYNSFIWYQHLFIEDIAIKRGDGKTPSDLWQLQANLARWLAAPSLETGAMGGYRAETDTTDARVVERTLYNERMKPITWKAPPAAIPRYLWLPGVIGARTALTGGGTGTVADWAAAAKAAGLGWLVILEDFEKLTPQAWTQFKKDCLVVSTADIVVAPGWLIKDIGGNTWMQFGACMEWPAAKILDATGKRIADTQNALFGIANTVTAPVGVKANPYPAWSYREYNSFSVVTQTGGELKLDDALPEYLYQQGIADEVKPLAVALLTAPAQLANPALYRTYLPYATVAEARQWMNTPRARAVTGYVSNGPEVICWEGTRMSRVAPDWFVPGTERWRLRLAAQSDVDLAEVVLYDGTELYARYLPTGKKFDVVLDGLHDQQRHFIAVITDRQGRRAITSELRTVDTFILQNMCSDRNNTINNSYQWDPLTRRIICYSTGSMFEKGNTPICSGPTLTVDPWVYNPPGWDGGVAPTLCAFVIRADVLDTATPRVGPTFNRYSCPLASKHVLIQQQSMDYQFKPFNGKAVTRSMLNGASYYPYQPLENWTAWVREVAPVAVPHDLRIMVIEAKIRFKRDVTIEKSPWLEMGIHLGWIEGEVAAGQNELFTLHADDGTNIFTGDITKKGFGWTGNVKAGGYFAIYPGPLANAAVMMLDDGYKICAWVNPPTWMRCYLGKDGPETTYAAGSEVNSRYLVIVTSPDGPPGLEQIEWVRTSMGITGSPAYRVNATQGTVLGTKFFLDLQAQDGGFTGVISQAKLPLTRLPIRIYGLNPHWSAAVYDRKRRELIPFGFTDGVGYASVDTRRGDSDVYIGSLATCDSPELRLWVVEESPTIVTVIAHNPTDKPITATVNRGAGYERVPAFQKLITVPAGSSLSWTAGDEKEKP
ncbi:MAG: hypothetical protein L6437_08665 [Kiritimatiellae bacterium]|nr:hypothetical protein [Verrucomicrobiota bacterium]MBU4286322.1 hypothetical protein [Verrucomicrobiota bacterium]MBU4366464.1 hypothetical protein [Verrucomicrobiota bacterium]MCG2660301.1 hypothetical protein [Kiritimatiellia bacterium]